jgi:GDP-L-fucose synthase
LNTFGVSENSVEIWGSGKPKREFLWSEDMADACVFIMKNRNFTDTYQENESEIRNTHINIGTGKDVSIEQLALTIKNTIGFEGHLVFNTEKPDGTMRKLTDVSKLNALGWKHKIELEDGLNKMYRWYLNNKQ